MKMATKQPYQIKEVSRANLASVFSFLFFILISASTAFPDSLSDILDSLGRKDLGKKTPQPADTSDTWFEKDSNLSKLFAQDPSSLDLIRQWLGDLTDKEYTFANEEKIKKAEYVSVSAIYNSTKGSNVILTVLVPHPKSIELINNGLIADFRSQEPPGLSITAEEKMVLKNITATFYQHKGSGCSLLYKLPKSATLNIKDPSCADARNIINFAELLNIDRLKKKLDS
jgi:hypothetical protein